MEIYRDSEFDDRACYNQFKLFNIELQNIQVKLSILEDLVGDFTKLADLIINKEKALWNDKYSIPKNPI